MLNVSQRQLAAAKKDFRKFLYLVWMELDLPAPTPMQYDIAHYLQHGPKRSVMEAFRGIGKSWITSAFVIWLLWNDPQLKILVISAAKDKSNEFSTFTKRLINEITWLAELKPDPRKDLRDSNVAFDVGLSSPHQAPSVKSVGVYGQLTGGRCDVAIIDDSEVPNNTDTMAQRIKLEKRVSEIGGALLTVGGKKSQENHDKRVIYLGTPQCEDSLYDKLEAKGFKIRIWPSEIPEDIAGYGGNLAPYIMDMIDSGVSVGSPTDPERFSTFELAERKLEFGPSQYLLQFMLDTTLADEEKFPLKTRDLIVMATDVDIFPQKVTWSGSPENNLEHLPSVGMSGDLFNGPMYIDPEYLPYTRTVMYIDPAGRGRDQVGFAIVKELHGMLIIRQWGGLDGGYDDATLTKLAMMAFEEKVNLIVIEDNFGDGMYTQLFRPVANRVFSQAFAGVKGTAKRGDDMKHINTFDDAVRVVEEKVGILSKEKRLIGSLEPPIAGHRVILDEDLCRRLCRTKEDAKDPHAFQKSGLYQMTRLSLESGCLTWDDQIDALAGAIRAHQERIGVDVDDQVESNKEAALQKELDKFMEAAGRGPNQDRTWANVSRR